MGELISRAAAIAEIEEYIEEYSDLDENGYHNLKWCAMEEARDVLSMLPAVDAVPVVRCKDCKYYHFREKQHEKECELTGYDMGENWYCADGERREANDGVDDGH